MRGSAFDEISFFSAIEASGARALLIGRRALVVLGLPVLTADYDFWLHADDIEKLNEAARPFDLEPNREPDDARKRVAARPKDAEDIRLLERLKEARDE